MNLKSAPATILLGVVGLVVLTALSWLLLISPALGAISEAGDAHTEAEDRNSAMTLELTKLRHQAEELPDTQKLAGRLDAMFPPTADQPGFFGQVRDAATASGIDLDDITTLTLSVPAVAGSTEGGAVVEPTDEPVEVSVSDVAVQTAEIAAEGDYENLAEFMSRLEKLDRAFLVSTVNYTFDDQNPPVLTITGNMYVAPPLGDAPGRKK